MVNGRLLKNLKVKVKVKVQAKFILEQATKPRTGVEV
jgi:hypothetical protein